MIKKFSDDAWEDYVYWQTQDKRILKRINLLIKDTEREPFSGIGKPETLKHNLNGLWSRRINEKNRMVYRIKKDGDSDILEIAALRYHY
jgi:toxin YoeB